ncbi:hypothetical protein EV368DRAFT_61310 [Lentinula lateritia]|uniref:Uncharacterized protein n=1 Tax=Lentinula aff. lateritia TaxID=2804960 RepID=A0ACC1UCZ8_9AGAR|nr:hypothetical protein F5876DRAFT_61986 [Lentinula aff. lateritia]KAJ3856875.1 hypothetical protein EV368DRAFT_61310 [Lentinula lateritia]
MTSPESNHVRNATVLGDQKLKDSPTSPNFSRESSTDSQNSTTSSNVVPPLTAHPFRTLVLCFDGFDSDNSNIVQLFSTLKKDDKDTQMVYYQAGIGTYTSPQIATPMMAKFSKVRIQRSRSRRVLIKRMGSGWYLDAHVMELWAPNNYFLGDFLLTPDHDQIKLAIVFAFLVFHGAHTLPEGMIHKVGILPACNHQQVPFAYKMFTRDDEIGYAQSAAFKKAFSVDATIEFVGVWSNTLVKTFRHAVSLDERRAKFKANLWNSPSDVNTNNIEETGKHSHHHHHHLDREYLRFFKDPNQKTDIEEVWFAGCHCDVGGGSVSNTETTNLARIPLRWMIRQCFKTNTGILFNSEGLRSLGLNPSSLWPKVEPRPALTAPVTPSRIRPIPRNPPPLISQDLSQDLSKGGSRSIYKTEEELDWEDSMSPIYDQLSLAPGWWALEFLPVKNKFHDGSGKFLTEIECNLGRARKIPRQKQGVKIHRSVKMRMEAQYENGKKYIPRAKFDPQYVTWVD